MDIVLLISVKNTVKLFSNKVLNLILILIAGGTFAWWTWRSNNTTVSFTVTPDYSCSADGGGTISSTKIVPTACTNSTYALKRTIKVNPTVGTDNKLYMDLWLNIKSIGGGLTSTNNFKYVLSTSSSSCTTGVVSSGTFQNKKAGEKAYLLSGKLYTATATDTYYLYIWLDSAETSTNSMNQSYSFTLGGICSNNVISSFGNPASTLISISNYNPTNTMTSSSTYTGTNNVVSLDASNNNSTVEEMNLYYQVDSIDSDIANSNLKFTIEKSTNGGSTYSSVATGDFGSLSNNNPDTISKNNLNYNSNTLENKFNNNTLIPLATTTNKYLNLYSEKLPAHANYKYKVYIYNKAE